MGELTVLYMTRSELIAKSEQVSSDLRARADALKSQHDECAAEIDAALAESGSAIEANDVEKATAATARARALQDGRMAEIGRAMSDLNKDVQSASSEMASLVKRSSRFHHLIAKVTI